MTTAGDISQLPDRHRTPLDWLRLWFLLRDPVERREYAITGFGLMACKYIVEFAVVSALTGLLYTPLDFVNPLLSARERFAQGAPDWFGMLWVLWALPFLWIAVSMSVRRALDAGISPWLGLLVLVPTVNMLVMLLLAVVPSRPLVFAGGDTDQAVGPQLKSEFAAGVWSVIGGIAVGALYASVVIQIMVYWVDDYGAMMFFGTPFVTGVASGYFLNLRARRSYLASVVIAMVAVIFAGAALLLFAVEGVLCLFMAAPIMLPLAMAGGPVGKFLADRRRNRHAGLAACLLMLPVFGAAESRLPSENEFVIATAVEIAASPDEVWRQVIAFPEITERPEWFFRLGIACPVGARIDGTGVGATRECVFSTGKFVEPITAWDAPRRLAFDVREQPEPMFELTPYRHIHPPHLDGAFRSTRGEFELVALAGGRTRLVGRTWYTLDIRPHAYWTIWTDWLLHRIHDRVLRHIKRLAEAKA